jgi:4'-phosphopantetheinyl transferase
LNLDPNQVDVWLARDPLLRDAPLLESFDLMLSPDERARVAGMRFEAGRHQQLVTRALARSVLSTYLPEVPPAEWRFELGEYGRPSVARDMPAAARALHFNIAHTTGLVTMAVGRMPRIGVDVERADARVRLAVARRYFSVAETASLEALPDIERRRRFQRLWTLKEAYLKAVGTGIVGGLASITFHFNEDGLRCECAEDDAAQWVFREFETGDAFLVALACRSPFGEPGVSLRDFVPRPS